MGDIPAPSLYRDVGFVEFRRNPRGSHLLYDGWKELISMRLELKTSNLLG